MKRTLFVGFDAACWEYFDPLLKAGRLPTIQQLIDCGSSGTLESTLPAQTPTAWSSIITGKNPGKHSVFDFILKLPKDQDFIPADANLRLGSPLWLRLNDRGVRIGLVNIPFNCPFEPVDGFVVCGFGTPESADRSVFPDEASIFINDHFPGFEPTVDTQVLRHGSPDEIYTAEREHQSKFVQIALELSHRYQVDVLGINLLFPDHANHKMPEMADVERAICETDSDLNQLIQGFSPENVMLFSDHGSRRVKGDFLLHAWLRDRGYCIQNYRKIPNRLEAANWVVRQWLVDRSISGIREKLARHTVLQLLRLLPKNKESIYWKKINNRVPYAYEHIHLSEELDVSKSPVILGSSYSGLLYINSESELIKRDGADKNHIPFVRDMKEQLLRISDPDSGENLFPSIYDSDSIYSGPALMLAPDLIIDIYESPWNVLGTFRRGYVGESVRERYFSDNFRDYGHHSRDGLFIFCGQDFKVESHGHLAHVMDLPATLLHLYSVPVPEDFDGRVMEDVIPVDALEQNPITYQPGDKVDELDLIDRTSKGEPYTIDDHLKALGYLD